MIVQVEVLVGHGREPCYSDLDEQIKQLEDISKMSLHAVKTDREQRVLADTISLLRGVRRGIIEGGINGGR